MKKEKEEGKAKANSIVEDSEASREQYLFSIQRNAKINAAKCVSKGKVAFRNLNSQRKNASKNKFYVIEKVMKIKISNEDTIATKFNKINQLSQLFRQLKDINDNFKFSALISSSNSYNQLISTFENNRDFLGSS